MHNENEQCGKYCVFDCHGHRFAIEALSVRSVEPWSSWTTLPAAPDCLAGLACLHKEFVPLFLLQEFVSPNVNAADPGNQMLFLDTGAGAWGILIDQVLGLESIEVSFNAARGSAADWDQVMGGSATFQDQFVSVIDAELLFELLESRLRSHWDNVIDGVQSECDASESVAV
ncbi:MAG: chemotaxis protein CheW [Pirellulaceae bacterium]